MTLSTDASVEVSSVSISSISAGDNNIGNVDIVTVPTDPFGANADAASATGSISAKLRFIAATGIPITGAALTSLQAIDDPVLVDDAAFTPATSSVMMAGFQADESSTDSVNEGDAGAARITLDRKIITTAQPHTTGGLSTFRSIDLDETEEDVKTSAGQVYAIWFSNMATTTRFLKLYNDTAANVSVGSTTPLITLALPGNTSDDISGNLGAGGLGITFDTAICAAATTGIADADTGAPSANDVIVNIFYK